MTYYSGKMIGNYVYENGEIIESKTVSENEAYYSKQGKPITVMLY